MHFGHSLYCIHPSHDVLTVISPIDIFMMIGIAVVAAFLMGLFFVLHSRSKVVFPVFLLIAVITVGAASNGTITLDAVHGTAVMHSVFFGYPQTFRYPLSSVVGASVASSDESDALRLLFSGGSDYQLTPYNQMRGKGEAAFAINQFLREHDGTGSPY